MLLLCFFFFLHLKHLQFSETIVVFYFCLKNLNWLQMIVLPLRVRSDGFCLLWPRVRIHPLLSQGKVGRETVVFLSEQIPRSHFLHMLTNEEKVWKRNTKPLIFKVYSPLVIFFHFWARKVTFTMQTTSEFLPQNTQHQVQPSKCLLKAALSRLPVLCSINKSFPVLLLVQLQVSVRHHFQSVPFLLLALLFVRNVSLSWWMYCAVTTYLPALVWICCFSVFFVVIISWGGGGGGDGGEREQHGAEAMVLKIQIKKIRSLLSTI